MVTYVAFRLRREREFGDVLNAAFIFLKRHFVGLSKSLLTIAGIPMLLAALVMLAYMGSMFSMFGDIQANPEAFDPEAFDPDVVPGAEILGIFPLMMIALFAMALLPPLVVTCYIALCDEEEGVMPTVHDVWARVKRHVLPLIGVYVLAGLATLPALVIALIPCLGVLALFLGGIYVGVSLSLFLPAYVIEGEGGLAAFKRSWALVRPSWWQTAGLLLVTYIIVTVLGSIANVPSMVLMIGGVALGYDITAFWLLVVLGSFYVVGIILTYMLSSIYSIVTALQYFNLVEQTEQAGLQQRVQRMRDALLYEDDEDASAPSEK